MAASVSLLEAGRASSQAVFVMLPVQPLTGVAAGRGLFDCTAGVSAGPLLPTIADRSL